MSDYNTNTVRGSPSALNDLTTATVTVGETQVSLVIRLTTASFLHKIAIRWATFKIDSLEAVAAP